MKMIYIHPLPVRIWHWVNAFGFLFMIVTGLQLRYPEIFSLMSFQRAVEFHNTAGFILIAKINNFGAGTNRKLRFLRSNNISTDY